MVMFSCSTTLRYKTDSFAECTCNLCLLTNRVIQYSTLTLPTCPGQVQSTPDNLNLQGKLKKVRVTGKII